MPIKINYLIPTSDDQTILGKIIFLNEFKKSNMGFPYLYMTENQILKYRNWPQLVPYLYDKTLGFFNDKSEFLNTFAIHSFSTFNGNLNLYFNDLNSIKILNGLYEDRQFHFFENNSYDTWNRTITPLSDITLNNKVFLKSNVNYKIEDIDVINNNSLKIKIDNLEIIPMQLLINKSLEFGPYRLSNQRDSIYFTGIKSKYLNTPDSNYFIGGLRKFSRIIKHNHRHGHRMSNHTHTMVHDHDMSHQHNMSHQHDYGDLRSISANYNTGAVYVDIYYPNYTGITGFYSGNQSEVSRQTSFSQSISGSTNINLTSESSVNKTTEHTPNATSNIINENIIKDDISTKDFNFKIGNKNLYNSNIIYYYMYGGSYIP